MLKPNLGAGCIWRVWPIRKAIATKLGLSVKTVETHRAQLMERLEARDIAALVRLAIRLGLVAAEQ